MNRPPWECAGVRDARLPIAGARPSQRPPDEGFPPSQDVHGTATAAAVANTTARFLALGDMVFTGELELLEEVPQIIYFQRSSGLRAHDSAIFIPSTETDCSNDATCERRRMVP